MIIKIIEGIVAGVAAGIVLSVFFWVIDEHRRRSERKEQMHYLARLIATHRERFYKPAWVIDGPPIETDIGKDVARKAYFEQMKEEINLALDGRSSRLSFDEVYELRRILNDWSWITDQWSGTELNWTDVFCGNIFGELQAIKWLDLPDGPNFFGSAEELGDGTGEISAAPRDRGVENRII